MSRVAECLTRSERVVIKSFLKAASSTHADENEDEIKEWHAGEVSSILTSTKRSKFLQFYYYASETVKAEELSVREC